MRAIDAAEQDVIEAERVAADILRKFEEHDMLIDDVMAEDRAARIDALAVEIDELQARLKDMIACLYIELESLEVEE